MQLIHCHILVLQVRLLQTLTLLVTTNSVCCGDILARCLVICFRLAFSKDNTIAATGGATIRYARFSLVKSFNTLLIGQTPGLSCV